MLRDKRILPKSPLDPNPENNNNNNNNTSLGMASSTKQCWFADDACGAGSMLEIKKWWDALNTLGPDFGYFPNAKKCWIISKADKKASVNVTVQGHKHLGAVENV